MSKAGEVRAATVGGDPRTKWSRVLGNVKAIVYLMTRTFISDKSFLIQFFMFPVLAAVMTHFVASADEYMPDTMFVSMFSAMFAGMILITVTAGIIAGEKENKSMRLLIMSGVKPVQFLIGVTLSLMALSFVSVLAFAVQLGGTAGELAVFMLMMMLGVLCSIMLGATIGLIANSVQSSTAIAVPVAIVLAFSPMLANFNDTIRSIFQFFYTMQVSETIDNLSANPTEALLIVAVNAVVLMGVFLAAYHRKGLKGL